GSSNPSSDQSSIRDRVVRIAEGAMMQQSCSASQQSCDGMDLCCFQRLLKRERRQDTCGATGQHRFSGTGGTNENYVVSSCCCHFQCPFGSGLSFDIRKI